MENQNLDKNVGSYLDRTLKIVRQNYLKRFKEIGTELSTEQWVLIDKLRGTDGLSQTELANDTYKNPPTVSRIIDLLVKKGLVERQRFDGDRRRYKVFLTPEGNKLHAKLLPHVHELRNKSWENLNDADWSELKRILDRVDRNFLDQS